MWGANVRRGERVVGLEWVHFHAVLLWYEQWESGPCTKCVHNVRRTVALNRSSSSSSSSSRFKVFLCVCLTFRPTCVSNHYVRPLGLDGEAQWTHCCAAKLEQLDGTKKNRSSDILSRKNDIQQNWKSFSELREETDLRLRAAYSQLQVRCTPCNAPVYKLLLSLRCIQCSANKWSSLWSGGFSASSGMGKGWFSRYQLWLLATFQSRALASFALKKASASDWHISKIASSQSCY